MNEDLAKQLSSILNDKNIDLNQILDNFKANSSGENTDTQNNNNNQDSNSKNQNNNSNSNQFDMDTILKMQKILSLMNNSRKFTR